MGRTVTGERAGRRRGRLTEASAARRDGSVQPVGHGASARRKLGLAGGRGSAYRRTCVRLRWSRPARPDPGWSRRAGGRGPVVVVGGDAHRPTDRAAWPAGADRRRGAPGRGRLRRRRRVAGGGARRRLLAGIEDGVGAHRRLRGVADGALPDAPRADRAALDAGDVTVPHVELLAAPRTGATSSTRSTRRPCSMPRPPSRCRTSRGHAALGVARRRRPCSSATPDSPSSGAAFTLSPTFGGSVVSGFLDPEAAATVADALAELQPPDGPADTRSLAQRNADGLVLMSQRVARRCRFPSRARSRGVDVVVGYDTLAGRPVAELDGLRCDIEGFGPIARITAERLACDCALGRVVVSGRSEILDLGRRTRTIPRRLRRAIRLRDQHCQFPGLPRTRPPGATCTISSTGCTAVRPTSRTARCCAGDITSPATRVAGSWRADRPALPSRRDRRVRCPPASCRRGSPACRPPCAARRSPTCRAARCTACCTSSQFVHIEPDETDTLAHVPAALLVPRARASAGARAARVRRARALPDARRARLHDLRAPAAHVPHLRLPGVRRHRHRARSDPARGRRARVRRWRFVVDTPEARRLRQELELAAADLADLPPTRRAVAAVEAVGLSRR